MIIWIIFPVHENVSKYHLILRYVPENLYSSVAIPPKSHGKFAQKSPNLHGKCPQKSPKLCGKF